MTLELVQGNIRIRPSKENKRHLDFRSLLPSLHSDARPLPPSLSPSFTSLPPSVFCCELPPPLSDGARGRLRYEFQGEAVNGVAGASVNATHYYRMR